MGRLQKGALAIRTNDANTRKDLASSMPIDGIFIEHICGSNIVLLTIIWDHYMLIVGYVIFTEVVDVQYISICTGVVLVIVSVCICLRVWSLLVADWRALRACLNMEIESVPRICLLTDSVDRFYFGSKRPF